MPSCGPKVIQGDLVASVFELAAGGDDLCVGLHCFQHFEDSKLSWAQSNQTARKGVASAVHKGESVRTERCRAENRMLSSICRVLSPSSPLKALSHPERKSNS